MKERATEKEREKQRGVWMEREKENGPSYENKLFSHAPYNRHMLFSKKKERKKERKHKYYSG